MAKEKELLFSVTAKDCDWDYVRGSGKGGQKRNKTSSAVRCRHRPSGAIGYAEDTRSQATNKQLAFRRMAESAEFIKWQRVEAAKHTGEIASIKQRIEKDLQNPNTTRIEGKDEKGRWVNIEESEAYKERSQ